MGPHHTVRPAARVGSGLITLVVAAAVLLIACSGSSTPSVSTAPDGAATCANAATLKAAVARLTAVDVATVGSDELKSAIDGVAAATDQLIQGAHASIAQELEDMEGTVNVLEAAYEEASTSSIAASAAAIDAAIVDVKTQAAAIELGLKPSCS